MNARHFLSLVMMTALLFTTSAENALSSTVNPASKAHQRSDPGPGVKDQISALLPGTLLEVRLRDRRKLTGRIDAVAEEHFELQIKGADIGVKEIIAYKDVVSFRRLKDPPRGMSGRNWAIVWTVVGFVGGLLTYIAIHRRK